MQALHQHPTAGVKVAKQEQLGIWTSGPTSALTFNQIRLILTLKQQGVDWNSIIVQDPTEGRKFFTF